MNKEDTIKQLRNSGYLGKFDMGEITIGRNTQNTQKYILVTIIKKGNKNIIQYLLNNRWEKISERKKRSFDCIEYSGYSMSIEMKKYYEN